MNEFIIAGIITFASQHDDFCSCEITTGEERLWVNIPNEEYKEFTIGDQIAIRGRIKQAKGDMPYSLVSEYITSVG